MSLFLDVLGDVLGWMLIVTGTVKSASALVMLTTGHAVFKSGKPLARSKAWEELRFSLIAIAFGVSSLSAFQSKNGPVGWVASGAMTVLLAWSFVSWLKSRIRRKQDHPTAELS